MKLHSTAKQRSHDQKIPRQKALVEKIGWSQVGLERRCACMENQSEVVKKRVRELSRVSSEKDPLERDIQLSLPSISRYSPLRPKKLRKYHERDETHRTSMSGVSIPRCSIDLNPRVKGNGSLTMWNKLGQLTCPRSYSQKPQPEFGVLISEGENPIRRRFGPRSGAEVSGV